jgi:hypothetical protein
MRKHYLLYDNELDCLLIFLKNFFLDKIYRYLLHPLPKRIVRAFINII